MAKNLRSTLVRRLRLAASLTIGSLLLSASAASAAQIILPSDMPADTSLDPSLPARQPSITHDSDSGLLGDRPVSDFVGTQLDFTKAQIQLFRFRLDDVPSDSTVPRQKINAGGIKLKWSW